MAVRESFALVLEDTELGRWALQRALEGAGFKVVAVPTWAEASACLVREKVGLALVAVSSVVENVTGVVTDICRDHPDTHLILLADQDSVSELRNLCGSVADILTKPIDLAAMAKVALQHGRPSGQQPGV
jgi:DNA-binding NtrC family response regulator